MALQKKIDILETLLSVIPDAVIVADLEGRFLLFNPAAERILGIGAEHLNPEDWTAAYGCYLPDKITPFPPHQLPLFRAIQGEKVDDVLIYIKNEQKPSGVWISVSGKPLLDEDGAIQGGMVIFRDATKRKLAEERFHSASSCLAVLIENQQSGILIENEAGRIVSINQAFCDLFNILLPPAELIGTDCTEYAEQAKNLFLDPEAFVRQIQEILHGKSIVMNEELFLADGRVFQRDYIPLIVDDKYRGHLWQYRDNTERHRIQDRIKVYERLCTALEQTADSVIITDRQGVIEYVNPAFEMTTGFSRTEALGRTPQILKSGRHNKEFYRNLWAEVLAGRPFRCTIVNKRKTGEFYWAQQTITPLKGDDGDITHFVSVLKDITDLIEKKDQEAKLLVAREVQQRFYGVTASVPGYDIAGTAFPAEETGGDYFDFINMPGDCLGIAIGDVCGHGVGAALVMAETRAYLRSFASCSSDMAEILSRVNQSLVPDLDNGQFVTLLLCCLDPHQRILRFASAGHVPGFLLNKSGEVDSTLGGTGPPLGLFPDSRFSSDKISFSEPGQVLLLPTDGIMESMDPDGTPFGIPRVVEYLGFHRRETARQIVEGLCIAAKGHAASQSPLDDITAVVIKVI
ncbi:MAG: SpoIIE family protein phosphatase [Candidatus Zixiibacteriota bacterium]|nr:MAG: SpoIIE family protein phosphatase [candidate division Zixibacteria bacterium]